MDFKEKEGQKELISYLDRIEKLENGSSKAVFLVEEAEDEFIQFILPANFLPEGTSEGEYLTIRIIRNEFGNGE